MKQLSTSALIAGGVLVGAAFGPSVVGAQTDSTATEESSPEDTNDHEGRRGHRGEKLTALAELLGMTEDEVKEGLRGGATIADLAESSGVDEQVIIDAIVANIEERVAAALDAGRITDEQADDRVGTAEERATDIVNGVRPERGEHRSRGSRGGPGAFSPERLAERLDAAVDAGRLTEEKAAEMLAAAEEFAETGEFPEGFEGFGHRGHAHHDGGDA